MIDNRSDMSDSQKFQYLKLYLEGPPLTLVQNYATTAENYKLALDCLREWYSSPKLLEKDLYRRLKNISAVSQAEFPHLSRFYMELQAIFQSFITLKKVTFGRFLFFPRTVRG